MIRACAILLAAFVGDRGIRPVPALSLSAAAADRASGDRARLSAAVSEQGPVLALPVLQADLVAKAGSDTVCFGRDSDVLTTQSQATLTRRRIG